VIDTVLLPRPYASSLGGFVEPTALLPSARISLDVNLTMKRKDAERTVGHDSMSLVARQLPAKRSRSHARHHRPRFARALMSPSARATCATRN